MIAKPPETEGRSAGGARRAVLHAADWLCLAATPTFAVLALLTSVQDRGAAAALCSAAQVESTLSGMALMYALMSVFHVPPWLSLMSSQRSRTRWPWSTRFNVEKRAVTNGK